MRYGGLIYLDSGEDHGSVGVGEAWGDPLTDALGLLVVLGLVGSQGVQDEDLAPLCALVQCRQQLVDGRGVQVSECSGWERGRSE